MKQLKYDTSEYMELSIEAHDAFRYMRPYTVDFRLLCPASNSAQERILASIEALTNQVTSFTKFSKDVVEYVSVLQQSIMRYFDVIEKQCKLSKESITPLLKADEVFKVLNPDDYSNLSTTRVNYFEKDNKAHYPLAILEQLSNIVSEGKEDDIKYACVDLLRCKYIEGQLDYPIMKSILLSRTSSLEALGHSVNSFINELKYLSDDESEHGTPSYMKLIHNKKNILSNINKKYNSITDRVKRLQSQKYKTEDIQNVMKSVADLQCYAVALSSIMFLLQSASYTAYEAGYALHLAEVSYNN